MAAAKAARTASMSSPTPLPCKAEIIYTARPGKPSSQLTFRNWRLGEPIAETEFTANIPSGYERIPVIERIPKAELKADAAKALGAAAKK